MTRKRCNRHIVVPRPPRWMCPRLSRDQIRDLGLAHIGNLDSVASGHGSAELLWQVAGGVLTWSRVSEKIGCGIPEMKEQLELMTRMIQRFRDTGRVEFIGQDYEIARGGVDIMDALAEIVDSVTAMDAAEWAETRIKIVIGGHHEH